jgi:hypothetical protein
MRPVARDVHQGGGASVHRGDSRRPPSGQAQASAGGDRQGTWPGACRSGVNPQAPRTGRRLRSFGMSAPMALVLSPESGQFVTRSHTAALDDVRASGSARCRPSLWTESTPPRRQSARDRQERQRRRHAARRRSQRADCGGPSIGKAVRFSDGRTKARPRRPERAPPRSPRQ